MIIELVKASNIKITIKNLKKKKGWYISLHSIFHRKIFEKVRNCFSRKLFKFKLGQIKLYSKSDIVEFLYGFVSVLFVF